MRHLLKSAWFYVARLTVLEYVEQKHQHWGGNVETLEPRTPVMAGLTPIFTFWPGMEQAGKSEGHKEAKAKAVCGHYQKSHVSLSSAVTVTSCPWPLLIT